MLVNIQLKEEWDYPTHIEIHKSSKLKVEREKEESFVLDFLKRRTEGGLLISGKPGSGKTSLIHSAIHNLKSSKILFIEVNATLFENRKVKEESFEDFLSLKRVVIQNIIQRFNDYCQLKLKKPTPIPHTKKIRDAINLLEKLADISNAETFKVLHSTLKKTKKNSNDLAESILFRKRFDQQDLTIMQNELEKILKLFKDSFKICFMIDEVDKIDEIDEEKLTRKSKQDKPDPHTKIACVMDVAKSLKTLINTENALFIFVTSELFYDALVDSELRVDSNAHTLFSETLFLQRPTFDIISEFIDKIIVSKKNINENNIEEFKYYLTYVSRNSFYDVYRYLRDFIEIKNSKTELNISLSENQEFIAKLQKIMSNIFQKKQYQRISNFRKNSKLRSKLYELLELCINLKQNESLTTKIVNGQVEITTSNGTIVSEDVKPNDDTQEVSLRDFIYVLTRYGYLKQKLRQGEVITYEVLSRLPRSLNDIKYDEDENDSSKDIIDTTQGKADDLNNCINDKYIPYLKGETREEYQEIIKNSINFKTDLQKIVRTLITNEEEAELKAQELYAANDRDIKRRYTIQKLKKIQETIDTLTQIIEQKIDCKCKKNSI